jgi:enoyl-CoA hydratase/carnithine racemase
VESIQEYETVVLERDGPVAQLRLNRPASLNALYRQVYLDACAAIEVVRRDDDLRCLVITGSGDRAFCAGGDIKLDLDVIGEYSVTQLLQECEESQDMIRAIRQLPKPVIARVNGVAVGGGCDLALACDIVIATTEASFGEFWVRRGIIPDMGGGYFLPRLIGTHRAKELTFTGDLIEAEEAARINLINQAVEPEKFDATVYGLAARLANMPTMAIAVTKELINRSTERDLDTYFETAKLALHAMVHTDDHREGVDSFMEKRDPVFRGR